MLFRDKEHEIRWGDMLMSVIRQDPLHRAVYYLLALAGLLLGDWYDEVNDRIKIERLRVVDLDWSSRCAVALAYDILNKEKEAHMFPLLAYYKSWLPYFVQALEMCHDYTSLIYTKVFVVDKQSGCISERYRFSEALQGLLFGSYLEDKIDTNRYELQILYKSNDIAFILKEGKKLTSRGKLTSANALVTRRSLKKINWPLSFNFDTPVCSMRLNTRTSSQGVATFGKMTQFAILTSINSVVRK